MIAGDQVGNLRRLGQLRKVTSLDLASLRHPTWWGALALLLINDNLLKGRGLVPSWLTGKLSDFAFLIVAPVVFAVLLPAALPRRKTFAVLSVVGLFVATDLSPAASDAVVAAAAHLGMTWRLWPDPTDLIALAVLPLTFQVLRSSHAQSRAGRLPLALAMRERLGLIAGAFACLATTAATRYPHRPFLVNRTAGDAAVHVTWLLRSIDCMKTPQELASTLDPSDLDDPRVLNLASGEVAVLDGPTAKGESPVGQCHLDTPYDFDQSCIAAILEADDAAPVLMVAQPVWEEGDSSAMFSCSSAPPSPVSKCHSRLDPKKDPGHDAVSLLPSNDVFAFEHNAKPATREDAGHPLYVLMEIAPIDLDAIRSRTPSPGGCRAIRDEFNTLLASSSSCTSDSDCQATAGVPIPGATHQCAAYLNHSVAPDEVQTLNTTWSDQCATKTPSCPPPQPAVCHDGICGERCPGVNIPNCPASCDAYEHTPLAMCGFSNEGCLDPDGNRCLCNGGYTKPQCEPMPQAAPDCPIKCLERPVTSSGDASTGNAGGSADDDAGSARNR